MVVTTLLLEVAFVVCCLGLRAWWHHRQTGSTGLVGISADARPAERVAGVLLGLAVVAMTVAPLMVVFGLRGRPNQSVALLGIAAMVVALAACSWAQWGMGTSWRVGIKHDERTDLVTGGLFNLVRNPIYSTMVLFGIGVALAVQNVAGALVPVLLLAEVELFVRRVEEPYLRRQHPDRYDRYARRVGRFVPVLGRLG